MTALELKDMKEMRSCIVCCDPLTPDNTTSFCSEACENRSYDEQAITMDEEEILRDERRHDNPDFDFDPHTVTGLSPLTDLERMADDILKKVIEIQEMVEEINYNLERSE